jgi:hypothetical protein
MDSDASLASQPLAENEVVRIFPNRLSTSLAEHPPKLALRRPPQRQVPRTEPAGQPPRRLAAASSSSTGEASASESSLSERKGGLPGT